MTARSAQQTLRSMRTADGGSPIPQANTIESSFGLRTAVNQQKKLSQLNIIWKATL